MHRETSADNANRESPINSIGALPASALLNNAVTGFHPGAAPDSPPKSLESAFR